MTRWRRGAKRIAFAGRLEAFFSPIMDFQGFQHLKVPPDRWEKHWTNFPITLLDEELPEIHVANRSIHEPHRVRISLISYKYHAFII